MKHFSILYEICAPIESTQIKNMFPMYSDSTCPGKLGNSVNCAMNLHSEAYLQRKAENRRWRCISITEYNIHDLHNINTNPF